MVWVRTVHTLKHCLCITTIMIWHAKIRGKFEEGGRKRQFDFILLSSAQPFCVSTIWYLYTEEVHIFEGIEKVKRPCDRFHERSTLEVSERNPPYKNTPSM